MIRLTAFLLPVLLPTAAAAQDLFEQKKFDLASSSPPVRSAAVEYFRDQHSAPASAVLLERLAAEKNPGLKIPLIEALDVNASTQAFAALALLLEDQNPHVAQAAAISLGACGDPERLLPVFEKGLKSGAPRQVKLSIVNMLGFHRSTGAVALLDSLAADGKNVPEMRRLAVGAMTRIASKEAISKAGGYSADKDPLVSAEGKKAAAYGAPAKVKPAAAKAKTAPAAVKPPAAKPKAKPAAR